LKSSRCLSFLTAFCAAAAVTTGAASPVVKELAGSTRVEVFIELPPGAALSAGAVPTAEGEKFIAIALLDEATGQPGAPIFGRYWRRDDRLTFTPRFALAPGARYRITDGGRSIDHQVPALGATPVATVKTVSPSSEEVPANLLKFYLTFTHPMREGREIFTHIHLLDEAGQPLEAPWRDTELWADNARRLTLWIHPGRVKRGVNLREELGPVLRVGARYTLVVETALRDATGQPLAREFRHTFRATSEIHTRLDLATWTFQIPSAGTREPLRVRAPVPFDEPLAVHGLAVRTGDGHELGGNGFLDGATGSFTFTPGAPWPSAPLRLDADPRLEDLAGNTFERVFDTDLTAPAPSGPAKTSRPFTPR